MGIHVNGLGSNSFGLGEPIMLLEGMGAAPRGGLVNGGAEPRVSAPLINAFTKASFVTAQPLVMKAPLVPVDSTGATAKEAEAFKRAATPIPTAAPPLVMTAPAPAAQQAFVIGSSLSPFLIGGAIIAGALLLRKMRK